MKKEDIATDVDYEQLGFLESHLMHEYKRMNMEEFRGSYLDLEKLTHEAGEMSDTDKNFVMALIQVLTEGKITFSPIKFDKYVLDSRDFIMWDEMTQEEIDGIVSESIDTFREFGFLYSEICYAV